MTPKEKKDKKKSLMIITTPSSSSSCFTSILKSLTCGASNSSPRPSDRPNLPESKSNGYICPNELESLDENASIVAHLATPRQIEQPGLVARLMGLESFPNHQDLGANLRSKSLNSLHLYFGPTPCLRRAQSTSKISSVDMYVGEGNRRKTSKEGDRRIWKCTDQRDGLKKEIKCKVFEEKLGKVRSRNSVSRLDRRHDSKAIDDYVVRLRRRGSSKKTPTILQNDKQVRNSSFHANHALVLDRRRHSKDDSTVCPRRRSSTKKTQTGQQNDKQVRNLKRFHRNHIDRHHDFIDDSVAPPTRSMRSSTKRAPIKQRNDKQVRKLRHSKTRDNAKDYKELAQAIRLAEEEHAKGEEWVKFDDNVKEIGVDFAREMLQVLINKFIYELVR